MTFCLRAISIRADTPNTVLLYTYIVGSIGRAIFEFVAHVRERRVLEGIPEGRDKLVRKFISKPRSIWEGRG